MNKNRTFLYLSLGTIFIALVYIGIPCYRYFGDGLNFALDIRDKTGWILHPHHPMYPLLPQFFFNLIGRESSGLDVLDFLIAWSIVTGLGACIAFIYILRTAKFSTASILIGLGLFAFTSGVWYFSVTPNQNSTPLIFHVITLASLITILNTDPGKVNSRHWLLTGLLTILAIIASQVNFVLILPALFLLFRQFKGIKNPIRYIGYVIAIFVGVFIINFILSAAIEGVRTPADFIAWQHSSVFQQRWWIGGFQDAIIRNWHGLFNVHLAGVFSMEDPGSFQSILIKIAQIIAILFLFVELIRAFIIWKKTKRIEPIQIIGLLTAIPVFLFTCLYAPEQNYYRILYLPGFILFMLPSIESHYLLAIFDLRKAYLPILALICLFVANLFVQFIPLSNPMNNPKMVDVMELMEVVDSNDSIIYKGSDDGYIQSLYAKYFLECDSTTIGKLIEIADWRPAEFLATLQAANLSGGLLLIHEDVILSEQELEKSNLLYGSDLTVEEIIEFLDRWFINDGILITIEGRNYYRFIPRDEVVLENEPDQAFYTQTD